MTDAIESPCILICSIDIRSGFCHGCGRTRDEIGAWTLYSAERRRQIMADLPARVEAIGERRPRRQTRRQLLATQRSTGTG